MIETNAERKTKQDAMECFGCTEQEYLEHQKMIEGTLFYQKRKLYHSFVGLGNAIKESFNRGGRK